MPFTASHVAAVLPLTRTRLIPSALVVGSMVPDLPYFLSLPLTADTTHHLPGVVGVDALAGLAVLAVWHLLLAERLHAIAPPGLRRRIARPEARLGPFLRLPMVYLSLVVGALTHITWDGFTHPGRWGVQHVAWLSEQHGPLGGAAWAQYACTLLGAAVVAGWLVGWWRRTPASHPPAQRPAGASTWLLLAAIAGTVTVRMASPLMAQAAAVTNATSAALVVVLIVAIIRSRMGQQRRMPDRQPPLADSVAAPHVGVAEVALEGSALPGRRLG